MFINIRVYNGILPFVRSMQNITDNNLQTVEMKVSQNRPDNKSKTELSDVREQLLSP